MTRLRPRDRLLVRCFLTWLVLASVPAAHAQWSADPLPVCTATGDQFQSWTISDGQGGAVLVWVDERTGPLAKLYAQRITHEGIALWGTNGVPVDLSALGTFDLGNSSVISDGLGGALIATPGPSGSGIVAQRLSPDGGSLWAAGGVAIPAIEQMQTRPALVADGSGGAILAWVVRGSCDIRANRVSSDGSLRWSGSGVAIRQGNCDSTYFWMDATRIAATSDGHGGAIIAWTDGQQWPQDIHAQRVDSTGTTRWAVNGVAMCADPGNWGINPVVACDGAGGAVVAWKDGRIFQFHVFAQRIDANGQRLWAPNGQVLDSRGGPQYDPVIVSDGTGGAIVSWCGVPTGSGRRYVQRVLATGATAWSSSTTLLSAAETEAAGANMVSDGAGGAICTWLEDGTTSLMAQRIDGNGNALWTPGGNLVTHVLQRSVLPNPVASDGAGGSITAWGQGGVGGLDLFAQHVESGVPVLSAPANAPHGRVTVSVVPNPSRGATVLFAASAQATQASIAILDIHGRVVRQLGDLSLVPATQKIRWDGLDQRSRPVGSGIYFARVTTRERESIARFAVVR